MQRNFGDSRDWRNVRLTHSEAVKVLQAYCSRKGIVSLTREAFDKQINFINDPCRLKAILASRRAGKSEAAAIYLLSTAMKRPHAVCLFIGLTNESMRRGFFAPGKVFRKLDKKYGLNCKFNSVHLSITLPNESVIYLLGVDGDTFSKEKIRNGAYDLIVIDECASYTISLKELVYDVCKPATIDNLGTICLIGTPGTVTSSVFKSTTAQNELDQAVIANDRLFFYFVTEGMERGWGVHKWNTLDNPHMTNQFRQEMDEERIRNPRVEETPRWRKEMLGQWVIDTDNLIYKFNPEYNAIDVLPQIRNLSFILSGDWGNKSALVVGAYSPDSDILFIIDAWKKHDAKFHEIALKVKEFQKMYPITKYVCDHGKQTVHEISNRTGVWWENAAKTKKHHFIEMMNSDFITGKIQLVNVTGAQSNKDRIVNNELPNTKTEFYGTKSIKDEIENLIQDPSSLVAQEHPACQNHLCDAMLYLYRFSFHYQGKIPEMEINDEASQLKKYWHDLRLKAQEEQRQDEQAASSYGNDKDYDYYYERGYFD